MLPHGEDEEKLFKRQYIKKNRLRYINIDKGTMIIYLKNLLTIDQGKRVKDHCGEGAMETMK